MTLSLLRSALPALAAILAGCATVAAPPPAQTVPAVGTSTPMEVGPRSPSVFDSPQAAAQYHILAGELAAARDEPEIAADNFIKALEYMPDAQLAARATALALSADKDDLALAAAKRWLESEPNSQNAREVIARLALRGGQGDEAFEQARAIVEGHAAGLADGYREVALLLSQEAEQADRAIALMQRLVALNPRLAGAQYALGLLAFRFNKSEIAEAAAREALRLEPGSKDAALLLAGVQLKQGDLDDADRTVEGLLAGQKGTAPIRLGYIKLLLEHNHRDRARQQAELLLKSDPDNEDAHYALGLLHLDDRNPDAARPHFEALARKGERSTEAAYYLGRIEELADRPAQALRWYEKVTSGNQALDAAVRRAAMLAKLDRLPEARALLETLRRQLPQHSVRFLTAEAELLFEREQYAEGLEFLNTQLQRMPEEPDLLYSRSLVYEKLGRFELAEADLERMIEMDADDSRALNALGYMLTLHTDRFEEAQQLVARALKLSPDDAAVIDSMGWVEYRRGNLEAAREWLRKAFEKLPDPEIAAHLGEVLWAMGDKEEARKVWAAALEEDPNHQVLRETVDRLTR